MIYRIILLLSILSIPGSCVSARTYDSAGYYVSPTGADTNPGTLPQPWKTLTFAVGQIHAGDTLYIRGGTYSEQFYVSNKGTQTDPIVITNYNGEEVIIDGKSMTLPDPHKMGGTLIGVSGDWVIVKNITIAYSGGMGIAVTGSHDVLDNLYVHHSLSSGAILFGNYAVAQNIRVWSNSMQNVGGKSSVWSSGISCARYPDYCTIRKSTVWGNWGEGISTFETLHTTIEDNIAYDNQENIYISDTKYTLVQRNLVYCTPGNPIDVYYPTQEGISIGDELGVPIPLGPQGKRYPSSDNTFLNNLAMGCNNNLAAGKSAITNNLFAYNTFVNATGTRREPSSIIFFGSTASNVRFMNNIIVQEGNRPIAINVGSGIFFSNNLWSKAPPTNTVGKGDVIGDPQFAKTGTLAPGQLTADYFRILSTSPARNNALQLEETDTDFFMEARGALPDIGADQYHNPTLLLKLFIPTIFNPK